MTVPLREPLDRRTAGRVNPPELPGSAHRPAAGHVGARRITASVASQVAARAVETLAAGVCAVLLVRHLGAGRYGDLLVALTVASLVGLVAEAGLPKVAVREISRDPVAEDEVLGTVMVLRLALSAVALVLSQLALVPFAPSGTVRLVALIVGLQYFADAAGVAVLAFHVRVRQEFEAGARLVAALTKVALVLTVVAAGGGLVALAAALVVPPFVLAAAAVVLRTRVLGGGYRWAKVRAWPLLRAALPVGPATVLGVLYLKIDALAVAALADRPAVGLYGAAYQPVEYAFLGSALVIQVLFPLAAAAHGHDHLRFTTVYRRGAEALVALALAAAVGAAVGGGQLLGALFGARFEAAAPALTLLAGALAALVLNCWQGFVLLAGGRQRLELHYLAVGLATNIVLDVVLVPRVGLVGAAWGTLVSSSLMVVISSRLVRAHLAAALPLARLAGLAGCAAVAAALGAAIHHRWSLPWPLVVATALGCYGGGAATLLQRPDTAVRAPSGAIAGVAA